MLNMVYMDPEAFKKFKQEPLNKIVGMPYYYTIENGQFVVWPKFHDGNPIPQLAWKI